MELTNLEIAAVIEVAGKIDEAVVALTELELVAVGGGTGDVHFG